MLNLMKIRPVGAELFHADGGQTNMTKLIVAFRTFAKVPKMLVCEVQKHLQVQPTIDKGKGKTIPLQAWTGPYGSRRLRLPDF
jgi:hypothetical protein